MKPHPVTVESSPDSTSSLVSPNIAPTFTEGEPLKLGILASGSGSNFEAVAQAIAQGKLNAQIKVLIYNNPEAKVAARGAKWNVPSVLLNHRDFQRREDLDLQLVQTLRPVSYTHLTLPTIYSV